MSSTDYVKYTNVAVYVNNRILAEETNVSITQTSGSQAVRTEQKGYSGESPGSAMCEVQVDNVIPIDGMEFDPSSAIKNLDTISFTIHIANKKLNFKGTIYENVISKGVDQVGSLSFKARGKMVVWS